ncbi:hypothetical protein [Cellvibrio sp. PSBB006]|uniref:hypothetical protein n=1 Tax=Cellvibrio sp. PSBB006 TaxID=1987723 RepID=UPI000B3B77C5|nr:hypothetical protein [Cellvibrio sp. PSBB006]ARU28683.1 hypothetical protein CBR65_15200 [Cellvibrio sp. PSBB006]
MKKLAVIVLIFTFSKSFAIDFEFEGVMEGLKSDERDINFSGSIECDESGTYQYQKTGIPIPLTSLPIFRELERSSENMLFW